jgi:hypothetical protein
VDPVKIATKINPKARPVEGMAFVDAWSSVTGKQIIGGIAQVITWTAPSTAEGFLLRKLRRALRLTLDDAARALGWGLVEVSEVERGIRVVRRRDFRAMCLRLVQAPSSLQGLLS